MTTTYEMIRRIYDSSKAWGAACGSKGSDSAEAASEERILAALCAEYLESRGFGILPIQGKIERAHLYRWIAGEEPYVEAKFGDQREQHDTDMRNDGVDPGGWWYNQIVQYFGRAEVFLAQSRLLYVQDDHESAKIIGRRGTQALAKAFLTAKGCVESAIRVYAPLPRPGVSSGNVEIWTEEENRGS